MSNFVEPTDEELVKYKHQYGYIGLFLGILLEGYEGFILQQRRIKANVQKSIEDGPRARDIRIIYTPIEFVEAGRQIMAKGLEKCFE